MHTEGNVTTVELLIRNHQLARGNQLFFRWPSLAAKAQAFNQELHDVPYPLNTKRLFTHRSQTPGHVTLFLNSKKRERGNSRRR